MTEQAVKPGELAVAGSIAALLKRIGRSYFDGPCDTDILNVADFFGECKIKNPKHLVPN